jgi:hypothetical protein
MSPHTTWTRSGGLRAKAGCTFSVMSSDISHMDQSVSITGKFSSIVRTTADVFKINFDVATPL